MFTFDMPSDAAQKNRAIAHRACMAVDVKTTETNLNVSVLRAGKARHVMNTKRLKVACLSLPLG